LVTEKPTPPKPLTGRAVQHRKLRVDEVHKLDLCDLRRNGFFDGDTAPLWSSSWWWGFSISVTSKVYYRRIDGPEGPVAVAIVHPRTEESGCDDPVGYAVPLEWTPCNFGGARPWFRCRCVIGGRTCNRRARILYKAVNSRYFACRECRRLSYRSRQTSRNWLYQGFDRAFRALDALDRASDPRCGVRRKRQAIRRLRRAEPSLRALQARLGG
jgi:hypothetical protein